MPGFPTMDSLINALSLGQRFRSDWNKNFLPTTAGVAGQWSCLARGAGNPAADALYNTGTNLLFQPVYDNTANNTGMQHGGNVSPAYKSILNANAYTAAATVAPCVLMLVDMIGFYRITSVTTITSQALTNTLMAFSVFTADSTTDIITLTTAQGSNIINNLMPYTRVQVSNSGGALPTGLSAATDYYIIKVTDTTFKLATSYANAVAGTAIDITANGSGTQTLNTLYPRYTNGAGVQAFMWNTNAVAMGAATPNLSLASYTNSAQATGRVTPATLPIGKTAAENGMILYSGTGSGKYGPFMPLQGGDAGIAKVDNAQISVSYVSGEFSIAMCVPLLVLPITTLGVASERDLLNQIPSLPRVFDGANIQALIYNGAATPTNSAIIGAFETAWN